MDEVERLVRASLAERAGAAPPPGALLQRVRVASARRRRRDLAMVAGVLATVAAALAAFAVPHRAGRDGVPTGLPVGAAPSITLGSADPYPAGFPFTPTAPLGDSATPDVGLDGGVPTLWYPSGTVTVGTAAIAGTPAPVVRGHPSVLNKDPSGYVSLSWREGTAQWVTVRAVNTLSLDDLVTYAGTLAPRTLPVTVPFAFDRVPVGLPVDNVTPSAVTFRPPEVPASGGFSGKIAVLLSDTAGPSPTGRAVQAGTHPAHLATDGGVTVLSVDQGDGRTVVVQVGRGVAVDEPTLLRFAAGIHPTAAARAGKG